MDNTEKLEAFLKDYEAVVRKHNIRLGGCGCCGSPFPVAEKTGVRDHIAHIRSEGL